MSGRGEVAAEFHGAYQTWGQGSPYHGTEYAGEGDPPRIVRQTPKSSDERRTLIREVGKMGCLLEHRRRRMMSVSLSRPKLFPSSSRRLLPVQRYHQTQLVNFVLPEQALLSVLDLHPRAAEHCDSLDSDSCPRLP